MSALHFGESRQNRADTEIGGFAPVDAGEQWVGEAVDHFSTVVPLDERCDAFVVLDGAGGKKHFLRHAHFGLPGKKR